MTFFALVRNRPIVLMYAIEAVDAEATIAAGVFAAANSFAVALLTPLSVACADSTTATQQLEGRGVRELGRGFGLAARRRS